MDKNTIHAKLKDISHVSIYLNLLGYVNLFDIENAKVNLFECSRSSNVSHLILHGSNNILVSIMQDYINNKGVINIVVNNKVIHFTEPFIFFDVRHTSKMQWYES